jgi:hypothetical protein
MTGSSGSGGSAQGGFASGGGSNGGTANGGVATGSTAYSGVGGGSSGDGATGGTANGGDSNGGSAGSAQGGAIDANKRCLTSDDCTECDYPSAPVLASDCYCVTCQVSLMSENACLRNRQAWQDVCSGVPLVCPAIECISIYAPISCSGNYPRGMCVYAPLDTPFPGQ